MIRRTLTMPKREPTLSTARLFSGLAMATLLASACNGLIGEPGASSSGGGGGGGPTGNGTGTGSTPGTGTGGASNTGTGGSTGGQLCIGSEIPNPKRIVRLSFNQVSVSIHAQL